MALNRSKSRYAIKECSTCGSWYTKECCSIGNLNDQIIVPEPDSSVHCAVCGTPVDGPYCHGCTLIRKKFEKDLFTYCVDNGVFQNFQDTSESSNDNTNVVNAPREPSVVDQDPGVNISQDPPQIDHNCAHSVTIGPPKRSIISELERATIEIFDCSKDSQLFPQTIFLFVKMWGSSWRLTYSRWVAVWKCYSSNDLIESMQNFLMKNQPEYLQELLQNLLTDLQILNEIQPLKQEISNQIQKDREEKSIEERLQKANQALNESQSSQEMRIQDLEIQKQQCLEEMKEWMNELGMREYRKEEIDIDYRRKCEDKIYELKDKFNGLSIEIRKIIQEAKEFRESEARARSRKIIIDDDDDDLGFYAVHPNTIHTPVSQNFGEFNLFDIDDSITEKSTSRLAHLAPISPEIVEACVDDDDTDDYDDYDDNFYDCVDIEEDGGEIDLDISKIVDISLREKLVESYLLIEKINTFNLSPPIPISPILCPSSTIPVVDLDLPLEEADVLSFSDNSILRGIESDRDSGEDTTSIDDLPLDDSMIFSEYESFTFDDEPVMAEINVFDEINTSELSYPGIGENVVLDEEKIIHIYYLVSF
ncbi:hypothetical protein Tco_0246706 [Tanacetum coccineum]